MLTTLGLLGLLVGPLSDRPRVEIWTDRADDPYATGQGVRVHFRTEQDAYVTILRIDTDGRVRVLFPREPWEDNFARAGRDYDVPGRDSRDSTEAGSSSSPPRPTATGQAVHRHEVVSINPLLGPIVALVMGWWSRV